MRETKKITIKAETVRRARAIAFALTEIGFKISFIATKRWEGDVPLSAKNGTKVDVDILDEFILFTDEHGFKTKQYWGPNSELYVVGTKIELEDDKQMIYTPIDASNSCK